MKPLTFKSDLRGRVELPASKSISNRALFINALVDTPCEIENLADCDDTAAMLHVVRDGVAGSAASMSVRKRKSRGNDMSSDVGMGNLFAQENVADDASQSQPSFASVTRIDIGAAGTAMRFATALLAVREGKRYILCGTERMHQRPIKVLVDALRSLGAEITYEDSEGFPPLAITGHRLTGTTVELPADVSSQYISALLMLGPMLPQGLQLRLRGDIISRPYINLTLHVMAQFGARAMWIGDSTIYVHAGAYRRNEPLYVERDWSAASYWYELLALSDDPEARIDLPGLKSDSVQGDSRVSDFFAMLGVRTEFTTQGVRLTKQPIKDDTFLQLDLSEQPDLAQTLVVTCAMLGIPFHFTGLQTLRIKETDRITALQTELHKFGVTMQGRLEGELLWDGHAAESMALLSIDTYDDHRMAMAFAPCAMRHPGLVINNPGVVSKSYPDFWDALRPFLR